MKLEEKVKNSYMKKLQECIYEYRSYVVKVYQQLEEIKKVNIYYAIISVLITYVCINF